MKVMQVEANNNDILFTSQMNKNLKICNIIQCLGELSEKKFLHNLLMASKLAHAFGEQFGNGH